MKGLQLNEIIVIDLLELVLIISAEDLGCQGTGDPPRKVGGRMRWCLQVCEAETLTF